MEPQDSINKDKKTRDLPNLSECHSCGFRIDSCDTNGKNNKLHTLYSEWRIVLLCKSCYIRVESSNLCSYCFKTDLNGCNDEINCFQCPQCKRIVHNSCLSKFSKSAPWSFCAKNSVCIDCWVPKCVIAKRVSLIDKISKRREKNSDVDDVVREANYDLLRKSDAAIKARSLAVEKALAARKASKMANNVLESASNRAVYDVELALQLEQVLNRSPRVSSDLCTVSSNGLDQSLGGGNCGKVDNRNVVVDPLNVVDGVWIGVNGRGSEVRPKEGEGSCSDKLMNSESQSCREGDGSMVSVHETYNRNPNRYLIKYARTNRISVIERCNRKPELFLIKYARRTSSYVKCDEKFDRYLRKYTRRGRVCDEAGCAKPRDRCSIKYMRRRLCQKSVLYSSSGCLFECSQYETRLLKLDGSLVVLPSRD